MRYSKALIQTNKTTSSDEALQSVIYLIKGGFITQVGAGIYDFLPLGHMALNNVKKVIKEELDNAGAQEVTLAFVCPYEAWQKSGRAEKYGKELLRFKDRKNADFVLSPTCEELMVEMVKSKVTSWRQLPLNVYQTHLKFRDEVRPRFGLLRGREFWMKDGYSFHESTEDMLREFYLMQETYSKIFKRLGLEFKIVEADSGAIGGSGSKEFMVLANAGEDTLCICNECDYGANIEAARRKPKLYGDVIPHAEYIQEVYTPKLKTIDELSAALDAPKTSFIKAIAKLAIYKDETKPIIFFICGADELEETKALNACGAIAFEDLDEETAQKAGIKLGFIGLNVSCDKYVDLELIGRHNMIMGSDKIDHHISGVSVLDGSAKDLIAVKEEDECIKCGAPLKYAKGIEVGHIFQLGTRYSQPLEAKFLDKNGKAQPFIMGTYGIGVSRLLAAIVEQWGDAKGCVWPMEVAPYKVVIIISNIKDEVQRNYGEELYEYLKSQKISVLLDDRDERYGHKMADFELLGHPYAVVIGKNLAEGVVEVIERKTLIKESCSLSEIRQKLTMLMCSIC